MSQRRGIGDIIDTDYLKVGIAGRLENQTANAAKTVNTHSY